MERKIKLDIQFENIQKMIDKSNRLVEILEEAKTIQKELADISIDINFNSTGYGKQEDT